MGIEDQVKRALIGYVEDVMKAVPTRTQMKGDEFANMLGAAMLSGMSLTARFLAANEGSESITPQRLERAVQEVAAGGGLVIGKIP